MKYVMMIILTLALVGCADAVTFVEAAQMTERVGFFHGLWHGLIIVFSFIGSLFSDSIAIYAIYNTGGWYDFGFILGCVFWFSLGR